MAVNVIDSADLWFPGHQPPLGHPHAGEDHGHWVEHYDPVRYVVWVPPGRPGDELAPRQALHVQVTP
jgi:hypothetical protein